MKRGALLLVILSVVLGGCMINPLIGGWYTSVSFHSGDHQQDIGSKSAERCVTNILGLIATGDASAAQAAKDAGIKKITSIDYKMTNTFGFFGTYCVLITGE